MYSSPMQGRWEDVLQSDAVRGGKTYSSPMQGRREDVLCYTVFSIYNNCSTCSQNLKNRPYFHSGFPISYDWELFGE